MIQLPSMFTSSCTCEGWKGVRCASCQPEGFQSGVRAKARDPAAVPSTALSDAHGQAGDGGLWRLHHRLRERARKRHPKPHS